MQVQLLQHYFTFMQEITLSKPVTNKPISQKPKPAATTQSQNSRLNLRRCIDAFHVKQMLTIERVRLNCIIPTKML